MDLKHLQQQLDQYARLHGIKGGMSVVVTGTTATVFPSGSATGYDEHLFAVPANDIGTELTRRIGLAMDRRCA